MPSIYFLLFLVVFVIGQSPPCVNFTDTNGITHCIKSNTGPVDGKDTPLVEISAVIPPENKNGLYYLVITLFVLSTFASTILSGIFLAVGFVFWSHFKQMTFFWFLIHLTLFVFVMSSLNFLINVPATLFSLITAEFVKSDAFFIMSNIIDFCHNAVLFSNLIIAIHRFSVFFLGSSTEKVFGKSCIFLWLSFVWVISAFVVTSMMSNSCSYEYDTQYKKHYILICSSDGRTVTEPPRVVQAVEILMQIAVPILIFIIYIALIIKIGIMKKSDQKSYEMTILKQAIFIFVLFQISSIVFLLCQTVQFEITTAFLIKRVINTAEIFAGAATPCFFFFTSKDIRKLITVKVSATSSLVNSNSQQRRQTLRST
ncbi:hypothetical protein L5515_008204 [Caenorhabditis briggsae]|uniref:G-protein coupled receptors family 1 profile domain-containing protein n=1 Tax=Caenorhabditis briggsae TaxID=6238 RepID=A0AAE9JKI7_CAEBR|nr:hypothetical protein L5515_008204 [Caenorhabditis briggsae]